MQPVKNAIQKLATPSEVRHVLCGIQQRMKTLVSRNLTPGSPALTLRMGLPPLAGETFMLLRKVVYSQTASTSDLRISDDTQMAQTLSAIPALARTAEEETNNATLIQAHVHWLLPHSTAFVARVLAEIV
ncbi:hypothetical protein FRC04_005952 [Tulasnella sp. 424]|nr:hypothetical protein FRC04_005952 [Tulasnella sp. 424]KAG8971127.1 hypothetical protein FRC05_011496 [Tulasnella sp. 425]